MQRVNHRRVGAAMQYAVQAWLAQATPFGRGVPGRLMAARPAQIKAAAKQIVRSGKMPGNMRLQLRNG